MESAIIAATVAALVSLVGMLVNLRIAREGRQAAADAARMNAALAETRASLAQMRKYAADIERLRSTAGLLMLSLESHGIMTERFEEFSKAFENAFYDFFRSWDETKSEMDDVYVTFVRMYRHSCKNAAQDVLEQLRAFRESTGDARKQEARKLDRLFYAFQTKLDEMYSLVRNAKNERLEELLLGDLPKQRFSLERKSKFQRVVSFLLRRGSRSPIKNRGLVSNKSSDEPHD